MSSPRVSRTAVSKMSSPKDVGADGARGAAESRRKEASQGASAEPSDLPDALPSTAPPSTAVSPSTTRRDLARPQDRPSLAPTSARSRDHAASEAWTRWRDDKFGSYFRPGVVVDGWEQLLAPQRAGPARPRGLPEGIPVALVMRCTTEHRSCTDGGNCGSSFGSNYGSNGVSSSTRRAQLSDGIKKKKSRSE